MVCYYICLILLCSQLVSPTNLLPSPPFSSWFSLLPISPLSIFVYMESIILSIFFKISSSSSFNSVTYKHIYEYVHICTYISFRFHIWEKKHAVFIFLLAFSFNIMVSSYIHFPVNAVFYFSKWLHKLPCLYVPCFLYSPVCWWVAELILFFGCCA